MKQFSFNLKDEFAMGLRPDGRTPRHSRGLIKCRKLKPVKGIGLVAADSVFTPFPAAVVRWPFPQLIRGKGDTLLADSTTIGIVDERLWESNEITIYDIDSPSDEYVIHEGGPWHFADLGKCWAATNGYSTIFKNNQGTLAGGTNKIYGSHHIEIQSVCEFAGRSVWGGFLGDQFWSDAWLTFWQNKARTAAESAIPFDMSIGKNFVWWSSVGGGDMLLPLVQSIGISGPAGVGYGVGNPYIFDLLKRGDMGWMEMPWQGPVRAVLPLGDKLAVYGDDGIAILTPMVDPVPGFGCRLVSRCGIASRSAVGGGDDGHCWIDRSGSLWRIGSDAVPQRLGYSEYFLTRLGREFVVSFDQEQNEFYICDGDTTFVLTEGGLGELPQIVTSGQFIDGAFVGVVNEIQTDEVFEIESDVMDMGLRAIKSIEMLSFEISNIEDAEASLWFRYALNDEWQQSEWVLLNDEGNAYFGIAATEFKVALRGSLQSGGKIDGCTVQWKLIDKRSQRGAYAAEQ